MDLDKITEVRQTWQFYRDRRPDAYEDLVDGRRATGEPRRASHAPTTSSSRSSDEMLEALERRDVVRSRLLTDDVVTTSGRSPAGRTAAATR